jgi:hypothetical protein
MSTPGASLADAKNLRWDTIEASEQIPINVRDGLLEIIDSFANAIVSGFTLVSPRGGMVVRKASTIVGDVLGLLDNNPATKHVMQGILSRQLLRFGAGAAGVTRSLGVIHDTSFDGREIPLDDYVGDVYFHTRVYGEPSVVTMFGAVVISDVVARPVGGFLTIFGGRDIGQELRKHGLDLIETSMEVKFF